MTKNLKRFASALLSAAVCVSMLAGCNKTEPGTAPEETVGGNTEAVTQEGDAPAAAPSLTEGAYINTDWTYGQVAIGGGGFVTGVFSTPQEGLYYARTDVGGAYYRTPETGKWISMNYWVSEEDRGLLGIDGLAYDPQAPNRVFMLAGTEYFSGGKTAVLISEDCGQTITAVDVTDKIKVHGNGMGRGNGERIAVDPNNGQIILAGGRTGGMIKSTDGGYTWEAVTGFPEVTTGNANGINCILFDPSTAKDGVTQKIFASVSEKGKDNIFVSEDGGASWSALSVAVTEYMPQRMKLNSKGDLYVTYADNEGPWNAKEGSVLRYNTDGSADDISPAGNAFGDIVIDPNDDNRLILVTTEVWVAQPNGAHGDAFYTSADGGKSWHNVLESMTMSTNDMPWVEGYAIHWCSSLALDRFNTGKIMVNSGNGIFSCDNIWDDTPAFYFDALGIEEVVPLDIITLEDYPLISAIGDYDGFVHEDIFTPADKHHDNIGTTTSITVAAQNRDHWAKVGGNSSQQALTYTSDAGKTWKKITKSPDPDKTLYEGHVALNADGSVLVWSPSNGVKSYWTEDQGETWNYVEGLTVGNAYIIGDPSNADYVYACGKGSFYVSTDGGRSFKKVVGIGPNFTRICVDPHNEGTIYFANGAGLLISKDHGQTADYIQGIKYCEAVGLGKAKNDGDPLVIYIWGTPMEADTPNLYMSEDEGATWVQVNDDLHQFGGTGNGVFVTGDMNVYGRCYMSTVGLGIAYFDKADK
ncbi:MAG: hypothetical protein J1F11_04700 [Oscillospiraceae bacterium]|nr:hypothetical protein [Oscillospiraceae bacterium]